MTDNASHILGRAIQSAYGQTLLPEEILRVDIFIRGLIDRINKRTPVARVMPDLKLLQARFRYEPETGDLFHIHSGRGIRKKRPAGQASGRGYIRLVIKTSDGCYKLAAHRVAWALYYNALPPDDMVVDHIDGDRSNNRIKNLRLLTTTSNNLRTPPEIRGAPLRRLWEQQKAPAIKCA